MSSVGFLPRSSAICIAYMISSIDDSAGSMSAYSGSSPPVISLDQRKSLSRSSCGTPSRPAMACSGSSQDTCSTKSPEPSAAAVLAIFWARCASSSSSRPTARGVNPREMILRSRVWCGASMLSRTLRCRSIASRVISCGQTGMAPFGQLREDVAASRHLLDVGMLGHEPVALVAEAARAAGHVDPVDRLGLAQLGEFGDGQTRRDSTSGRGSRSQLGCWGAIGSALLNCNVF